MPKVAALGNAGIICPVVRPPPLGPPSPRCGLRALLIGAWCVAAVGACRPEPQGTRALAGGPADSLIPAGPLGDAIRRGRGLLVATRDSLPGHVGNKLRCVSCHLDEGRRESGTWIGVFAHYPQYRPRSGTIETIEFRVNDCFRRSMNGAALDPAGRDMADIVAYFAFLSRGVAVATPPPSTRLQQWAAFTADTAAGARVFSAQCAACHGARGEGALAGPPLWGPDSYNVGAGMARVRTAAEFIRRNMPFDKPGTLTDQQAFDVAAYVNAQPRPDFRGKEDDWPNGNPPPDVAYPTRAARQQKSR
ncbi:MAG TPA: c-type cytochrome [Gemmatimonadales bacterium]|nr:c-type cytochrome [Gemmatimonadales bacterium]